MQPQVNIICKNAVTPFRHKQGVAYLEVPVLWNESAIYLKCCISFVSKPV